MLEGAGPPAEVNLAASDIANVRMARAANAACLLVADVDRGGVFASLVGTLSRLPAGDRRRVRGFVVNRFRGDPRVFEPGVRFLERRLQRPCLGVRVRARLASGRLFGQRLGGHAFDGYEIHLGSSIRGSEARPLLRLRRAGQAADEEDGAVQGHVVGTYLHGFFDDDRFRHALVRALRAAAGLSPPTVRSSFTADRDARSDRLAAHVRRALDVTRIESWLR